MLVASEGLQRLVMAELVRQRLDAGEGARAAEILVKVTGWRERDIDRYPGTSSWWVENYVDIFWVDVDDEPHTYEFRGTFTALTKALEQVIEDY